MNDAQGYFDGRQMAVTFSLLRENSLYWNYYIDNYLKGEEPADFDILYWNSDSTNLSATCASFLLRELYLDNKLSKGEVKVGNFGVDLSKVQTPAISSLPRMIISPSGTPPSTAHGCWGGHHPGVGRVGPRGRGGQSAHQE
ncbi:hypothetical protein MBH78_22820 [Oceanimonas sp. NS1]|nr:hypothetical protein [Oceanimonas sp. NS1]